MSSVLILNIEKLYGLLTDVLLVMCALWSEKVLLVVAILFKEQQVGDKKRLHQITLWWHFYYM